MLGLVCRALGHKWGLGSFRGLNTERTCIRCCKIESARRSDDSSFKLACLGAEVQELLGQQTKGLTTIPEIVGELKEFYGDDLDLSQYEVTSWGIISKYKCK